MLLIVSLVTVSVELSAQTGKKGSKNSEKPKEAGAEIDISKVEWPEYYTDYAQGGDFRKSRTFSTDEKYMAPYVLQIPLILTPDNDQKKMLDLWKKAVRSAFSDKDNSVVKMRPLGEESPAPTLVTVKDPNIEESPTGFNSSKPGFELPSWVRPYLENEENLERLFEFQYRLGNVVYCSSQNLFPLLIDAGALTYEEKMIEADKYYNAIYWWAASYPELFYAIDDENLKTALESKNKELIYHYGKYRFVLDETSKAKMAKEKKTSNKLVQP